MNRTTTHRTATKIFALGALTLLTGCVPIGMQTHTKTTVFGFEMAASPAPGLGGLMPTVRFGVIRHTSLSNPTSTNRVYAAPFESEVDATLGILSQKANEKFSTEHLTPALSPSDAEMEKNK